MMPRLTFPILLVCLLAGCGTTPDSVEWRVKPQSQYYARDRAEVFEVMINLLEERGYEVTRQAAAEGEIEAQTPLLESRVRGAARQYFVTAKLRAMAPGETAVELLVHEAQEGDFGFGVTKKALASHGRYDSIFGGLEDALGEDSWLAPGTPSS